MKHLQVRPLIRILSVLTMVCSFHTYVESQCAAGPNERIISGRLFEDINNNQIDDSEIGVQNVDVLIYNDRNSNGAIDPSDELLGTASTNASGNYSFLSLPLVRNYADNFSGNVFSGTNNNSGTSDWASDAWLRDGNNGSSLNVSRFFGFDPNFDPDFNFTSGTVQFKDADAGMYRLVNLSNVISATLSFQYDWNDTDEPSLDGGEKFYIQIDPENDGSYSTIDSIVYEEMEIGRTTKTTSIPSVFLGNDLTRIRLVTESASTTTNGEDWWIDNVNLTTTENVTNYLITTDLSTYPIGYSLTTDNIESAFLPTGATCDSDNDFGLLNCAPNCPPIVEDDGIEILQGESVQIFVTDNDSDIDGSIDISSVNVTVPPTNGTVIVDPFTGSIFYTPNGSYIGGDQFTYEVCDNTSPTPLCDQAVVTVGILQRNLNVCDVTSSSHTFYLPYPSDELRIAFENSTDQTVCPIVGDELRSIVSIKCPYPGTIITYDHWEDGYEPIEFGLSQATTEIWGDANPFNGVAPNYPSDFIPAGGDIVLESTFGYNPRDANEIAFDGRDRLTTLSNIALSYIAGDIATFAVQAAKTDVYDLDRFGTSFTVPFGENLGNQFQYTSLFIRASEDSTIVNVDTDANGTNDFTQIIDLGEVAFVDGGIDEGALITSNRPVGVDVLFGGLDCWGTRQVNLFPAAFYSDVYYTPVPTTDATSPVSIFLYNSLNQPLDIDWENNTSTGTFTIPASSSFEFQLPLQNTAYRFQSQTGDSYSAISVTDIGPDYDWSFNLISASQLTNFASIAWAPGSFDFSINVNPIWVTPTGNTDIYIKYDGNLADTSVALSPCGIPFDEVRAVNEFDIIQIFDTTDNDQSGLAIFTCDGTTLASVYGEDPNLANSNFPSLDVGTTIQPQCIDPAIFANNDIDATLIDFPVVTDVLDNDQSFLSTIDTTSVTIVTTPINGSVSVNPDGSIIYTPNPGYFGNDSYQYTICSIESPDLCDFATVFIEITSCPAALTEKLIFGSVFFDVNQDGVDNMELGIPNIPINIYTDVDQDGTLSASDTLLTTETSSILGTYQYLVEPQLEFIEENFSSGNYNGGTGWNSNWIEQNDDGSPFGGSIRIIGDQLRITDDNGAIYRELDLTDYSSAIFSFDFRRNDLEPDEFFDIEVSTDNGGSYTIVNRIFGNDAFDVGFLNSGNIDLTPYVGGLVRIRFNPAGGNWWSVTNNDVVFVDNIRVTARSLLSDFIIEVDESALPDGFIATTPTLITPTINTSGTCSEFNFGFINLCAIGLDSDNDGLSDYCDIDDDNDGIPDVIENSVCDSVAVPGYDALYNYENTLDDESINSYNAQNAPGESYSANAIVGDAAISFDGSYFVRYSDGTFLNQAITDFSYSFWFNANSLSGIQYLIDEGGSTNGVSVRLNDNRLEARIIENSTNNWDSENFLIPAVGLWNHVVLTYANGDLTLYLNDVANPTLNTDIGELRRHSDPSGFGGSNNGNAYGTNGVNGFNGLMDQIVHYPFALNASEVQRLYHVCDTDLDGVFNRLDLDSDNDGLLDVYEAGHGEIADSGNRISDADAQSGTNGLDDRVETFPDSGILNYNLSDSEVSPDGIYDPYELDSDGDGCFDATEEDVLDGDGDGIAGTGIPLVDRLGLVDVINPYVVPPNGIWQDATIFGTACGCKIARTNPHIHYYRPQY